MNARARGFSLVELMVALAIGLLLVAGIAQIYVSSKQSYNVQDNLARMQEAGRYAVEAISEDLRLAGYWGNNGDVTTVGGATPPDGTCTAATWGSMIEQRIFGLNDTPAGYDCIASTAHFGGDVLVVRYAKPEQTTAFQSTDKGDLFVRTSIFQGRLFRYDPAGVLPAIVATPPATTHRVVAHAYYIAKASQANPNCPTVTVPELARERLKGDVIERESLVRGIEDLQAEYGIDTNNDGMADRYVTAAGVTNWRQVMTARIWLLARSECPEGGYTGTSDYTVSDKTRGGKDGFRRQLYTVTVALRNRA